MSMLERHQFSAKMLVVFIVTISSVAATTETTCHCKDNCQRFPQSHCTSCQPHWFGKYCQRQNIAFGKETNQSSIFNSTKYGGPYPSGFAVDGNTDNDLDHYSCTHTYDTNTDGAWWMVFLGPNKHNISQMTIFLRPGYLKRNNGFKVYVDDHLCFSVLKTSSITMNVKCESPLSGNVITVRISGAVLTLCEVQVFVCSDGWFGSDCDKQCQCSDIYEACDKATGYCTSGCVAGKHGDGCQQECKNDSYGENCALQCGHCKDDRSCNKIIGACEGGCQEGYQMPFCETCTPERFGQDCASTCGHCKDGQRCNITTGHCSQGCRPGYMEPKCLQECANYTYGDNCSGVCNCMNQCEVCDKFTGACETEYRTQAESKVPQVVLSSLFGAACVALVLLGGFHIRLKREFSKYKAKKEERKDSVDNVTEEPAYDVITESPIYVNT